MNDNSTQFPSSTEVVVIGGGPAGLQAALTMGRVHRDVVVVDTDEGRNAPAAHMQNLITRDGTPPAQFREMAHEDLAGYDTVTHLALRAERITGEAGDFRIEFADGSTLTARSVILATGVRDELPPVPGITALWGGVVAHCPFCHGHEHAGQDVAVLGTAAAAHFVPLLSRIAGSLTVLTHGEEAPDVEAAVRVEQVTGLSATPTGALVEFAEGKPEEFSGIFVVPTMRQSAPFAEQLGLTLNDSGMVRIDAFGRTSVPGVYAAGDMAHTEHLPMPISSVPSAIGAGGLAGATAVADLLMRG